MVNRLIAIALGATLSSALSPASADDLLQVYRDALASDPVLASARANWAATQENVPQARAGLLPSVGLAANAGEEDFYEKIHVDPSQTVRERFPQLAYTVSASQPLYRPQNSIALSQAKQQVGQSDFVLSSAQQDLIIRVTQAYFDVLLARFNIELTESQKAAVSENLAQAKRNFEVGTATITDTNDAQAKYRPDRCAGDRCAHRPRQQARCAARDPRAPARRSQALRRHGSDPRLPAPNSLEPWIEQALSQNLQVRIAQANFDIATLEVDRQKAAHYPTVDLVASINQGYAGGSASTSLVSSAAFDSRLAQIGVQLNVPLYQGGAIDSRVRQAIANQDRARQDLETARRSAQLLAQTSFSGVTSGVAQIKAFEQALASAQVSYDSNKLGLEVGVRTNLDVLNQQQQVFQTRFNLAQAYYNFLVSELKLKQAVGTLTDEDVERINRDLRG